MTAWLLVLWSLVSWADDAGAPWVVRSGDTVASIAAEAGDPALEAAIREASGLGPDEEPPVGSVLVVPGGETGAACEPSWVVDHQGTGTITLPWTPDPRPLTDRAALPVGATVCTDAESFARVRLAASFDSRQHDTITLMPSSCVTVRASHVVGGTRASLVDLERGSVSVEDRVRPGRVIVQTEAGLTLGDAGGFRVAREATATRTEATASRVATLAAGLEVVVEEGYGSRTQDGEAPGTPVVLPTPGEPLKPRAGAPLRIPDFLWSEAPGALGYVVEVGGNATLSELFVRTRVEGLAWRPEALVLPTRDGGLWWRVITFDAAGFEGVPSEPQRFTLPGVTP